MEQNIRFHWCEKGESGYASSFVEEVGARDLAVFALLGGFADNKVDHVHFAHDILESTNGSVGDLGAR